MERCNGRTTDGNIKSDICRSGLSNHGFVLILFYRPQEKNMPKSNALTRRNFLQAAALGAVAAPAAMSAEDAKPDSKTFAEPALNLPLANDCDVIVCGGGPAGVSAAISAARAG